MRYALSDIHGCVKTFKAMLHNVLRLTKEDELFLLGDYIDRGPDSKGVLDEIIRLKQEGYKLRCLRGNHEQMLMDSRKYDQDSSEVWLRNGGVQALQSFGVEDVQYIPYEYIVFLNELEYYIELPDFILVHAGLNFESGDIFSDLEAMLWLRKYEVNPVLTGGRILVHGHTPSQDTLIREAVANAKENYRVVIDNGCVYRSRGEAFGKLCALNLDTMQLTFLPNQE